jgi:FKBP-type peptidyl-prolyl cis-trans isomerase
MTPIAVAQEKAAAAPETVAQKVSYVIGTRIGAGLKRDGIDLDTKQLFDGLTDGFAGKELKMTEEQMATVMGEFQKTMQEKAAAEAAQSGVKNLKEGQDFLAGNGKKEGVVTTESGLQYQVLTKGDGPMPTLNDKIKAHYHGTLVDGTVFDSSVQRGEPVSFPVSGVIKGWTEALQLMPVGSKWRIFVPSDLAYGANPRPGGPIGPNAALIFDVELLGIE